MLVPAPFKVRVGVVQLIVPGVLILATGGVVFSGTVTVTVFVHPLSVLVTVRVYVPPWSTCGFKVFSQQTMPGPLQS